jgi:GGDEF domain-containing protein
LDELGVEFEGAGEFDSHLASAARGVDAGIPHALLVVKLERVAEVCRECGPEAEAALVDVVRMTLYNQIGTEINATRIEPNRIAILKPGCLPRDARALGRRVRTALEGGQFLWQGLCFRLGATVGVLEMTDHSVPLEDQMAKATRACEAAAALGGDGVVVTTGRPEEQAALEREREWREHLNEII